ncbi:MAG: nucleotidyltransferase domain-containing protein [Candidatus Aenigmarchaeota archaeon]|nr:nucleotidyltransferase domain-containing protein [Candidatus Aenigmarchaeota archaeon]
MSERDELIAYALSFASFLRERLPGIRNIVLFGSVARGVFDKESDIDVFVDIPGKPRQRMGKLLHEFMQTQAYDNWRLKGVSRDIKPLMGDLKGREWESLHASICSDGILLYGKYASVPKGLQHRIILSFGGVADAKTRVTLHRKLFGYAMKGKRYPGAVERWGGEKLGSGVILVPIQEAIEARALFRRCRVPVRVFEVWKQ